MNKIISKIRVAELDTLSDVLVRLYKDSCAAENAVSKDANLSLIMAEAEKLSADITTAIKSDRVSSTLDEADIARDEIIRNLGDALTGYAAIPVAAKKSAAQNLLAVFGKYGRQITQKNFAEESSLIESMLEDFGAESLKADVAALDGVGELVSELRTAQDSFNKANDDFTNASMNRGESATSVKKSLISVLNDKLVPYLSAVAPLADYKDFATKCEAEIAKANATVSKRGK
ncbi:DUF6261 family protein [uncultured Treponema sp.]|uniref:DUF6261 family protein n=1 Tax=uncultured Treponema sp. TaxID=162155 RepID=UPI0025E54FE2|nr:DUF6261 family protein [uncultured Treponema sp.]